LPSDKHYFNYQYTCTHKFNEKNQCETCSIRIEEQMKAAKCFENFFPNFSIANFYLADTNLNKKYTQSCLVKYALSQSESMSLKSDQPMKVDNFNELKVWFVDKTYDELSDIELHILM
jgi:hypothetical protein